MNIVGTQSWKKNIKNKRFITWKEMDEGDYYHVSNEGHIMSTHKRKKILKVNDKGYVTIYKNKIKKLYKANQLFEKYFNN